MKRLRLCFLFLALCAGAPLPALSADTHTDNADNAMVTPVIRHQGYAGHWLWAEGDERLSLTLRQNGDKITGFHSAERFGGGKRDEVSSDGRQPSITGELHGPSAIVRFRSGVLGSEAYGHVRLTLRGKYLYWQLMDSTGENFLPDTAVLIRQEQ